MKKTIVIPIKREDLPKRRSGVKPSKVFAVKKKYSRKLKHMAKAKD